MKKQMLSPSEVAGLLDVTTKTIYRLMACGELDVVYVGSAARISRQTLDAWIAAGGTQAQRAARRARRFQRTG